MVFDNKLGPGAVIRLSRSGGVIPKIEGVLLASKSGKPQMPNEAFTWNKTGADIIQSEASDLSAKKRVTYFFSKLDVEGLRMGTVSKFFDAGLDTILKIVKAPKSKFLDIDGIQERTAQKIRQNIDQALAKMTLPALMDASGFFGALGEKRLTLIVKKYPDVITSDLNGITLHDQVVGIAGFQSTLAAQFVSGLPKFKMFYSKLGVTAQAPKVVKPTGTLCAGQTVMFTGFRSLELEAKIKTNGGTIGSSVNKDTTVLLVKDVNSASSKVVKAKALGIAVMNEMQFVKKYKL